MDVVENAEMFITQKIPNGVLYWPSRGSFFRVYENNLQMFSFFFDFYILRIFLDDFLCYSLWFIRINLWNHRLKSLKISKNSRFLGGKRIIMALLCYYSLFLYWKIVYFLILTIPFPNFKKSSFIITHHFKFRFLIFVLYFLNWIL